MTRGEVRSQESEARMKEEVGFAAAFILTPNF